jgi:DnaK suppressor protein
LLDAGQKTCAQLASYYSCNLATLFMSRAKEEVFMSGVNKNQIDTLRGIMELELARLVEETQKLMNPELKENINEIDGGSADVDDEAVADAIVDVDNAIIGFHLQKARDLNSALDRVQAGTYGVCIDCNENIGFERLSAYPTAKRCIKCQSLHEKASANRPASTI